MFREHYPPLLIAYLVALCGWFLAKRLLPKVWPGQSVDGFKHPWKEFLIALVGAIGVLAIGQAWSRGIRLPENGTLSPVFGAINQALIFAPILLVPVLRRQSWATAWLPRRLIVVRIVLGFALSCIAIIVYSFLRDGADAPWILIGRIWRYEHLDEMVQVFLEDLTIAILFIRLAASIGNRWATFIVACLFAAGHIPAMLSVGISWSEMAGLLLDAGLGVAVILALQQSCDIVWFWPIHFCLDMTQFSAVNGIG